MTKDDGLPTIDVAALGRIHGGKGRHHHHHHHSKKRRGANGPAASFGSMQPPGGRGGAHPMQPGGADGQEQ